MDNMPVLTALTDEDKEICQLQSGFAERLRQSAYYIVEHTRSDGQSLFDASPAMTDE